MDNLKRKNDNVDFNELFNRIDKTIREERLYLDPSLSLIVVCRIVGTNRSYASRAVTTHFKNFHSYLAIVRLELFFDELFLDMALDVDWIESEEIAIKFGFRSRRGLDRALIKETGLTYSKLARIVQEVLLSKDLSDEFNE